jgi:anti-sigma factor RsiW
MPACEGFEIAIEMRNHGAADPQGSARLDAHLAICPACRQFEIEARASEEAMRESCSPFEGGLDAARMWERIRRAQREAWGAPLLVAAGFFGIVALAALDAWLYGSPFAFARFPRVIVLFLAVTALFALRSAQTMSGLRRAERSGEDLLPALRQDVQRRFRAALFATTVLGGLALFLLLLWPFTSPTPGAGALRHSVGELLLVAGLLGGAIYGFSAALPRLRRERAELG